MMRSILQRVSDASVTVDGEMIASMGDGLVALIGVVRGDGRADAIAQADKIAHLRVFSDDHGKMNRSLIDVDGTVLVVSQFTLAADTRRGRRPSFSASAGPEEAESLIQVLTQRLETLGVSVVHGRFGAHMEVRLVNDGPVTIVLDTVDGKYV